MKFEFRNATLLILSSIFISCNGQEINEKLSPAVQKVSELNKIVVPENGFSSGLLDSKGNLWFTSNGGGVFFFDGNIFTNYTKKDGLSDNQVRTIFCDKLGKIWFGFNGNRSSGPFMMEEILKPILLRMDFVTNES